MPFFNPPSSGSSGVDISLPIVSTTSLTIGTGSKTFTVVDTTKFIVGNSYRAYNTSVTFMEGVCTSKTSTTVTLNVDFTNGTGTFASWLIDRGTNSLTKVLSADVTSNTTTLANVNDLSVHCLANTKYRIILDGWYQSDTTTTGGTIKNNYSNTPSFLTGRFVGSVNSGTNAVATELAIGMTLTNSFNTTGLTVINTPSYIGYNGIISFSADSDITLQFASEVAASNATLKAGSQLTIERL